MSVFADRICAALEDLLRSRSEWDEAPDVHFMYAEDGGIRFSDPEALVPSLIWAGDIPPTYKLAAMAGALADGLPPGMLAAVAPRSIVAAVFRFEAWSVKVSLEAGEPAKKYARALHQERMLHQHPDRTESRMAWAVTREHSHWLATQERVSGEIWSGKAPTPEASSRSRWRRSSAQSRWG